MPRFKNFKGSGVFSFFLFVFVVAGGWAAYKYAEAYYKKTAFEAEITRIILKSKNSDDLPIIEQVGKAAQNLGFSADSKVITLSWASDRSRLMVHLEYVYPVKIPFTEAIWSISFNSQVEEKFP